jgi:hypothetical protein
MGDPTDVCEGRGAYGVSVEILDRLPVLELTEPKEIAMTRRFSAFAFALLAATGAAAASELAPRVGHSIQLGSFSGAVYYTVEQDDYRVVATMASGAEEQPIRVVSTLGPGQRMIISVPQAVGQPSVDFEIFRNGKALLVSEPNFVPAVAAENDLTIGSAQSIETSAIAP